MKKISALSCLVFLLTGLQVATGIPEYRGQLETKFNRTTAVRVLLDSALTVVKVSSLSKKMLRREGNNPSWIPAKPISYLQVVQRAGKAVLALNDDILIADKVSFKPHADHVSELRYQAGIYRGELVVHLVDGKLIVVNEIPIEDYLIGTLPGEMSPTWELNTLKAQAVASRTYALYMVAHPKNTYYDVERSVRDQVYTGAQPETSKVLDAVRSTEGEMMKRNNRLVKIFFHARCGGYTESPSVVWNMPSNASFRRVECPYCQKNPFHWQATISRDEIRSALNLPSSSFRMSTLGKSPGGRISSIRIAMGSNSKEISADDLRSLIGYARLKSAQFEWDNDKDGFLFHGVGNGHGVGMCQWGAQHLARQGKSYRDILAHYYPDFALSKDRSYSAYQ